MSLLRLFLIVVVVCLAAGTAGTAGATENALPGSPDVSGEIRALTSSIDHLAQVIETKTGADEKDLLYQKLNLAIAYLNFRSRRIERLEQDVQATRSAKAQIETTLNMLIERQKAMEEDDPAVSSEESRLEREEMNIRVSLMKERVNRFDDEIVHLESRIYELQNQIDSVEEFVQKNLAL